MSRQKHISQDKRILADHTSIFSYLRAHDVYYIVIFALCTYMIVPMEQIENIRSETVYGKNLLYTQYSLLSVKSEQRTEISQVRPTLVRKYYRTGRYALAFVGPSLQSYCLQLLSIGKCTAVSLVFGSRACICHCCKTNNFDAQSKCPSRIDGFDVIKIENNINIQWKFSILEKRRWVLFAHQRDAKVLVSMTPTNKLHPNLQ
jgi:hypothetical protein